MTIRVPDTLTIDNSEKYEVSIRLWPDGLSFSGYIPFEKDSFFTETILFAGDMNFSQSLKNIFFENPCFSYIYKSFDIIFISGKYTLAPNDVYSEKHNDLIFSICHRKGEAGKILIQPVDNLNFSLLYEVDNDAYEFLTRSIINPRFIHYLYPLLISWQTNSFTCYPKQIYAYIHDNILDVVCLESGELLFVNSFDYEKDNDIVYYIMYACRHIGVNQLEDSLHFCGDKELCHSVMSVIKSYIGHADYLSPKMTNYSFASDKDVFIDALTLTECAL
jgi:hypothetical protein